MSWTDGWLFGITALHSNPFLAVLWHRPAPLPRQEPQRCPSQIQLRPGSLDSCVLKAGHAGSHRTANGERWHSASMGVHP